MTDKKIGLDFYAKVQTDVSDVKKIVKNLKDQLETLKLPTGATKSFEKSFERLEGQVRDFESLASNGVNSLADTKKVQAAWDKIAKSINGLGFSLKELDAIKGQIFPKKASENIKKANEALETYQNKLKEIRNTEEYKAKKKQISQAESEVVRTRKRYDTAKTNLANKRDDVARLEKEWTPRAEAYAEQAEKIKKLNKEYQDLSNTLDKMRADKATLESIGAIDSTGKVSSRYKNLLKEKENELTDLTDETKFKEKNQKKQLELEKRVEEAQNRLRKANQYEKLSTTEKKKAKWLKEQAEAQDELNAAQNDLHNFSASIEARKEALREEIELMREHLALAEQVTQSRINEQSKKISDKKVELDREKDDETFKEDKKLKKNLDTASAQLRNLEAISQSAQEALNAAEKTVGDLNDELSNIETDKAKNEWQEVVNTLKQLPDVDLDETKGDIEAVKKILEDYTTDEIKKTPKILEELRRAASGTEEPVRKVGEAANDTAEEFREMDRATRDMENLKDSILDFFSIGNTIQIFKNAVKNAIDTVKELDAVMTETAVVTDFSIGDMWEKLPEYTEEANKLGTSISSLYQATTLYYQQGLQSNEAMGVGVETMKMARIANMDAADATTAMTAALRGFNMEINETSATRVNDVYSELAAITAADTSQIATAMGKTASIAASANMEFETTAALLAQIIETTQEAPETAGTAMKTIIARFTEVKKLFDEGMLTGKDEEGEEININKIDEALKKVGISLKDFLKGEKGIDDIFLELASKWDTLDLATQRYIATTAAGSRQQSRFLAMMSNYDRTMELVNAANDSAGASQEQFNKTLDSLEAKLQELQNAWQQFTMGLANSDAIKWVVDVLTDILNVANQLTDFGSSGAGGFMTFLTRVLTIAMGLKSGGAVLKSLGKIFINPESRFGKSFLGEIATGSEKSFKGLGEVLGALPKKFTKITEGANAGKTAITLFGKALPIGPVAVWGAVIIAAAVALGILIKKAHDAQTSVKLEKVNKEIKKLDASIVETKNEIEEISSAKSGLDELNETFAGLTKGTDEWRSALIEINSQVVSLLEKYPDLESKIGENGQLTIIEESWNNVLESQQRAIENMSAVKIGLQGQALDLKEDLLLQEANSLLDRYTGREVDQEYATHVAYDTVVQGGAADGTDLASIYEGQGRLSSDEFLSLARYFSEHSISEDTIDGLDFKNVFSAAGITIDDDFNAKVAFFKDIIKEAGEEFYDYVAQIDEIDVSRKQQNAAFVANAIGSSELAGGKEYTDAIANTIASQLPEKTDYNDKIKEEAEKNKDSAEDIAEDYADLFGYFAAGAEVYKDATMSEKVDASTNAMKYAIAADKVKKETATQSEKVAESTAIKTSADLYDELMGGQDGSDITASTLAMFEGKSDRQIAELLGYKSTEQYPGYITESAEAKMMKDLGEGIFDEINSNLQKADDRIKKQRETTAQSFTSAGRVTTSEEIKSIEDRFVNQLSDVEVRTALDNAINSLKESGDQSIIQSGLNQLLALGKAGSAEDFAHMSEIISDVDWNSPIQAASQIQTYMKSADDATRQFGEKITALGPKIISASAQMEELFISAEYSDIEAEIKELVETHGELSGADVEALGEKYQKLGQFIENTQISVEGLGHAFELINNGTISTDQLTNSVLASLNTFQSLDTVISGILGKISEFNPGLNENDIPQFVNTAYETISENISKGAYGNSQNDAYLDFLLGPNWDKGEDGKPLKGDAYAKRMEQAVAELGKNRENLGNSWRNLAQGKNFWGEEIDTTITEDGYTKLDGSSLMLKQNADGSVDLEGFEGMTTEELVSELADAYGTSEEYAEMMLGDFANYSTELKQELDLNDYEEGFKQAYENLNTFGKANKKIMDSSEADAIDKLYGLESGTTRKRMLEQGVHFTNFYDKNGELRSTRELVQEVNSLSDSKNFAEDFAKGSVLDYDSMMAELEQLDLPESAKQNIANSLVQSFDDGTSDGIKEVEHTFSDGITRTIEVKAGQTVEQAIAQMEQGIQNENWVGIVSAGIANALTNLKVGLDEGSVTEAQTQLDTLSQDKTINVDINLLKKNITMGNDNGTITFSLSAYKKGLDSAGHSHDALVSEEGPELIQTKDGAYLSGLNGPEIVRINRGDTVYTAEETRRILQTQQHPSIPRHARGYGYGYGSGSSGGRMSSNSSESGEKTWENPFDKLYNLVREIDEELRQRERIERRYEQLLTSLNSSANEIIKVSREELTQLEKERTLQEELIAGRKWQIDQYQSENMDLQNYAQVTQNERGEDVLRIDWDAIEAVTDPDQGQKIEDYVSQLEEWFDELESAEDALWDIEDAVSEIKERGKDEYFDLEETIKEALVSERQDEIDRLTEIGNAINESNSELLNSIQQSIDKQRQDRENARTEEELAEKQRRLAYLQQDTSGANALEIKKLQKEIEEGREDYTDSLIDQKISDLQMQNDEAAKQRERQIEILQSQLNYYIDSGEVWRDVQSLMETGISKVDGLVQGSALEELLKTSEGFEGMSAIGQMEWMKETNSKIDQAISYLEIGRQLEDLGIKENSKINFTTADGKKMTGTVDKSGNVVASNGKIYSNVFQGANGQYYAGNETIEKTTETANKVEESKPIQPSKKDNPYGAADVNNIKAIQWALNELGYNAGTVDGISGWQTRNAIMAFQKAEGITADGIYGSQTREKMRLKGYKTGGLADFTGPAWLDGTKARPEIVLNAQDSRNFIQLRDILGSLLNRSVTNTSTENSGDTTYDIDINVESIGSDYDIEQIAGKIKSLINEDARYRNNNAISLQR